MSKGRVRWDEANLDEIEANKPIRKKIVEPKTPYYPMIEEDGSPSPALDSTDSISYAAHADAIRRALNKVAFNEKHFSQFGGWASTEEEDVVEKDEGEHIAKSSQGERTAEKEFLLRF